MADESDGNSVISWAKPTSPGQAALKEAPLVKNVNSAVTDAQKGDIGSVGSDVANFALGAASVAEDPLNALISAGLGFLEDVCGFLKTCVQQVTGNSEKLDECSEAFDGVTHCIIIFAGKMAEFGFDLEHAACFALETIQGGGDTHAPVMCHLAVGTLFQ